VRRGLIVASLVWAVVGAGVALGYWLPHANEDARVIGAVLSITGPAAAVGAARLLQVERDRAAGILLAVSAVTPTGFLYLPNVAALVLGTVLAVAPGLILRDRRRLPSGRPR
jgi:hypothetical protein